jgi:hypothetical protein
VAPLKSPVGTVDSAAGLDGHCCDSDTCVEHGICTLNAVHGERIKRGSVVQPVEGGHVPDAVLPSAKMNADEGVQQFGQVNHARTRNFLDGSEIAIPLIPQSVESRDLRGDARGTAIQ